MLRRLVGLALASLALALTPGCDGGPTAPGEPGCSELSRGAIACLFGDSGATTPWTYVIRNDAEYDAALPVACARPDDRPPRPGAGEMLVVIASAWSGCGGCVRIACVEPRPGVLHVTYDAGGGGDCDAEGVAGAWAMVPLDTSSVVTISQRHDYEFPQSCP